MNLLKETVEILEENGRTLDDVKHICGSKHQITKEDFIRLADTEYYEGFGTQYVATDLMIIGDDFWLERHEYDGSEWWEYKELPNVDGLPYRTVDKLIADDIYGSRTLDGINGGRYS